MQKEPPYVPRKHQRNRIQGHHPTPLGICFPIMEPLHFAEHKYNRSGTTPCSALCSWKLHLEPYFWSHSRHPPSTSGLTHDTHHRGARWPSGLERWLVQATELSWPGSNPTAENFASELWQFRLPRFASVFRRRH